MGIKDKAFERRISKLMTIFDNEWKIVLAFDVSMLVLSLIVMTIAGSVDWLALLIILVFSTLISFLLSRILHSYYKMSQDYLEELNRVNQELGAINTDLKAFTSTVVHDLKTPIASIYGYTYLLKEKLQATSSAQLDAIEQIEGSANKMAEIIDELLLLANIGATEVQFQPIRMDRVVESSIQRLESMVQETSAEIEMPESWPAALGYEPWIEEVWVNYISNALKYGGTPPKIVLGAEENREKIRFWVQDNGNGIAAEDHAFLFKEFTRLQGSEAEGHGLGLAIVRRIVDKLRGEVGVDSRLGQGSTFYFTLPMDKK